MKRLETLLPKLPPIEQDALRETVRRLTRSLAQSWEGMTDAERSVSVKLGMKQLNEQMDAQEANHAEWLKMGRPTAASLRRSESRDEEAPLGARAHGVTEVEAMEIATRYYNPEESQASKEFCAAIRVTEERPPGLFMRWAPEPTWYVWFLSGVQGLSSSRVVAVAKESGRVLGTGSAGDEG